MIVRSLKVTVAELLAEKLNENGVSDVFGIPGGVILDLLYAFNDRPGITPHLSWHEQAAGFEACGYAQYSHRLAAAYASRGPGFTNLLTAAADAYADSLPVVFITAHSAGHGGSGLRFEAEQELDTLPVIESFVKYAARIESADDAAAIIDTAINTALSGRKGPVFLDFSASVWNKEIPCRRGAAHLDRCSCEGLSQDAEFERAVSALLGTSKRPAVLIGDGLRQGGACIEQLASAVNALGVPVLSSRASQDAGKAFINYFGYIGSHGIRYADFIFAKADAVITLGNRLAFPAGSESYSAALNGKRILRVEADPAEASRPIKNAETFMMDIARACGIMKNVQGSRDFSEWLDVCSSIKRELYHSDMNSTSAFLSGLIRDLPDGVSIVCDVGNNEFEASRAYELSGRGRRIMYSKSFGALGCALPKAIGCCLSSGKPVLCITGDQGFQINMQELQFLSQSRLPVAVLVINNRTSGMMRDRELRSGKQYLLHTTASDGYGIPDLEKIAAAYSIGYVNVTEPAAVRCLLSDITDPCIIEYEADEGLCLEPFLPKGRLMQDMEPGLSADLYAALEGM